MGADVAQATPTPCSRSTDMNHSETQGRTTFVRGSFERTPLKRDADGILDVDGVLDADWIRVTQAIMALGGPAPGLCSTPLRDYSKRVRRASYVATPRTSHPVCRDSSIPTRALR